MHRFNKKNVVFALTLASCCTFASENNKPSSVLLHKLFFPSSIAGPQGTHAPTAFTAALKNTQKTNAQWADLGWPSAKPNDSVLYSITFNSQGDFYSIVNEGVQDNDAAADAFVTMYSNGAWHTISPVYTMQDVMKGGLAPAALAVYNNTPYVMLGNSPDSTHPENITFNIYKYNGGTNWVKVPNSTLSVNAQEMANYNSPDVLVGNNGKFVVTEVTAPGIASMMVYDPAKSSGWKTISVPLPENNLIHNTSFDAVGDIYVEYNTDPTTVSAGSGIEEYNVTTGSWDTTIPSFATAFPKADANNFEGGQRYFPAAQNEFSSISIPDGGFGATIYNNIQGVWLVNSPVVVPATLAVADILPVTAGGFYLMTGTNTDWSIEFGNNSWQDLGSGPAGASVELYSPKNQFFLLNNDGMVVNQNTLYVAGTEKSTGNTTLLKLTQGGN